MIGVRLNEGKRTNILKTRLQEIGLPLHILLTTSNSIVNTIGRTSIFNQETNKHALSITHDYIMGGPIFNLIFGDASLLFY